MDTALPQKFPFILDRNLAKANCTENLVCTSCDTVVLGCYTYYCCFVVCYTILLLFCLLHILLLFCLLHILLLFCLLPEHGLADVHNLGKSSREAGSCTAAAFLQVRGTYNVQQIAH